MAIRADFHLHSAFSGDCDTPMEDMIKKGIELGLDTMCFTEHHDIDYPDSEEGPGDIFLLQTDPYLYELASLKAKYADQIKLLFGVELGLQPHLMREIAVYAKSFEFDFVIGSSHICHGKDPYYPAFYEGRSDREAYQEYFDSILENVKKFSNFDVYGHLDYAVRYGKTKDAEYSYANHADTIDAILELLIEKGKGIELNTGGLRKGMKDFHPCTDILKRYRELGGEIITIGSDSHGCAGIATDFDRAAEALKACGFKYYTVFEKRSPEFIRL
ncbi:MAG: histidinol-phosphatase HisJ family protein [Acetatifactor sp.]|nr:histidinol-phosphatase HisJ family protein [Acetatifactor sp.]